ncbi:CHAP domain-containing protein [Nocardioides sp.]|uniref:CHAP domain-containing protein n=1 Tax=Nocardioides sp. TaxID=35761 RepID=UPI002F42F65A
MTRRAGFVLLLGLLTAVAPMLHPEPVSAASGVDDYPTRLKNAPQDSLVDPWQFYNRECTSFVAWRLNSENQVAFNDYWQGQHWGDASNWRKAAVALDIPVDNNPTRGAVAWWAAGSAGSSRGHVAWVQKVGDGAITIEEYNYLRRGGYDTRTISSSSSLWPSGFLHIRDTQIRNTVAPKVTGTAQVGQKLITSNGSWTTKNLTFSYQWYADGKRIDGATTRRLRVGADQLGDQLQARVTASKPGAHSGRAKSAATDDVIKGEFVNTTVPTVDGKAQVGIPLAADRGTWSPRGTFNYQWYAGRDKIDGATAASFTPTADQLGDGLKVRVALSAPGYRTLRVRSDPTDDVVPGQFVASSPPSVSGVAQVDRPLTASAGTWNPPGSVSYQWLANGTPISGATGTAYTPTPGDLRKNIAVRVTLKQRGYGDAVATSVATDGVAPGTFLNSVAPSISGTAQVGEELTADKGTWSPRPAVGYQWLVDGEPVPGATRSTFTPRPEDLGKPVTLKVLASRPGYLTAVVTTPATADVLPGVIHNHQAPVVSGRAVVGRTLRTTNGTWSITPDGFRYQWYAGSTAIEGATSPTYHPTAAEAGKRIHVVVTARSAGYTPASSESVTTDRVVFGRVAFDRPTIHGRAVVGSTLTARLANVAPSAATPRFQWYRDSTRVRGAREATYVVQTSDLGHHLHVSVTMSADNWLSRARRSVAVGDVKTTPRLHVRTSLRGGRVFLRLLVESPGITEPNGVARVRLGDHRVGLFDVTDGRGSRRLAPMRRGTHTLTVIYRGGPLETVGIRTVTVTIP